MTWKERDERSVWHPFSRMKGEPDLITITKAKGGYVYDEHGRAYIDGISSWWVNNYGHAQPEIAEAISRQASILEQVIFAGFTHPNAIELAETLLNLYPAEMDKVFFTDDGSTAVEVGVKMILQYWQHKEQPHRKRIIAFEDAYHGDTFGAMSLGGRSLFTASFEPWLFDVTHIPTPIPGDEQASLERLKTELEKGDVALFVFEPLIQGAGGMKMYSAEVLAKAITLCQEYDVCIMADEVMTGFGRTGKPFAMEGISDNIDVTCLSKGLTGGFMALGCTLASKRITQAFNTDDKMKVLYHGHSYTANPIACAAALKSCEIIQRPSTIDNIQRIEAFWQAKQLEWVENRIVKDVRACGTIIALEIDAGASTSYTSHIRDDMYAFFLEKGIILRPLGNILYVLPPFCLDNEMLTTIANAIDDFLETLTK